MRLDQIDGQMVVTDDDDKRITDLEGDLSVARLQLARIDEELIGAYGEVETMNVRELRRILGNICYIIKPSI